VSGNDGGWARTDWEKDKKMIMKTKPEKALQENLNVITFILKKWGLLKNFRFLP
jgi:hypothetical protein